MAAAPAAGRARRVEWLDVLKGISILWIAYFHLYQAATNKTGFDPLAADFLGRLAAHCSATDGAVSECVARSLGGAITLLGFHAVNVFLILGGFGLARSLGDLPAPNGGWRLWYRRRLVRLYPLYWTAHLLLALSPFVLLPEPIDYRFLISLTGFRLWPIDMIHAYFNPAWWYFTCLVQLYLLFPLLWQVRTRCGPMGVALFGLVVSVGVRWLLLLVWPVNGAWSQGAFGVSRAGEFAFGMALGVWHRREPAALEAALFRPAVALAGLVVYLVGIASYRALWSYTCTDVLLGCGLFAVTANVAWWLSHSTVVARVLAPVGAFSYGLYLFHQPYVLYAGERWRELGTVSYLFAATTLIAVLFVIARAIERGVGRLTDRVLA